MYGVANLVFWPDYVYFRPKVLETTTDAPTSTGGSSKTYRLRLMAAAEKHLQYYKLPFEYLCELKTELEGLLCKPITLIPLPEQKARSAIH